MGRCIATDPKLAEQRVGRREAVIERAFQRAHRADLVRERQQQADVLADMKAQAAGLSAQRRVAAADLGPVRYLAVLAGVPADDMLRWFLLLVSCLLDPAAVLLLLAATSARRGS